MLVQDSKTTASRLFTIKRTNKQTNKQKNKQSNILRHKKKDLSCGLHHL